MKKRLVHTENGHNKYYEMEERSHDGMAIISYGRIGQSPTTIIKPMSYWKTKYREKIAKGYRDVSESRMSLEEIFAELDKLESKFS